MRSSVEVITMECQWQRFTKMTMALTGRMTRPRWRGTRLFCKNPKWIFSRESQLLIFHLGMRMTGWTRRKLWVVMESMILTFRILKTVWIALSNTSIQTWLIFRCRDQMAIARKTKGNTGLRINSKSGIRFAILTNNKQPRRNKSPVTTMHSSNGNNSNNIRQWRRGCQWQSSLKVRTSFPGTQVQCSKGTQSSSRVRGRSCQIEHLGSREWTRQDQSELRNPSWILGWHLSKNRRDEDGRIKLEQDYNYFQISWSSHLIFQIMKETYPNYFLS